MRIGVVKERKDSEARVALTPAGAAELARQGHRVLVESGAGQGSSFSDDAYSNVGAQIVSDDEAWGDSELVLKVKEPTPSEYKHLREDLILFAYLHLAADSQLAHALMNSGTTAIAYETVETSSGELPLLAPMSEIAGRLAAQAGALFLESPRGGRGLLLGGVPGVPPARVVVLGGGVVGYNAALIAAGLGADVTVLERSIDRMRHLDQVLGTRVRTVMTSTLQLTTEITGADLIVGAVLLAGARAPKLVTRDHVSSMKSGAVIVDVAIDQGGCVETARPTTHADPVYHDEGVLHYCVTNMPGAVPITSTMALTNVTLPYVEVLANQGLRDALRKSAPLSRGVNTLGHQITHQAVADALGHAYTSLSDLGVEGPG